ncbi:MAG: hypothetical protein ABIL06_05930 [Pseudomonadota bacterium]
MPSYDSSRFTPPAPVDRVMLRNPDTGVSLENIPMLLDSGADVTLIPQSALVGLKISLVENRRYELIGFDGNISLSPVARLDLVFCGRTFRGLFILIDQEWGIIGRNVINAISLLLDGPRLVWDEKSRNHLA